MPLKFRLVFCIAQKTVCIMQKKGWKKVENITNNARVAAEFVRAAIDDAVTALMLLQEIAEGGEDDASGITSETAGEG